MTTTHTSPLVGGPYATYDLPTTLILWTALMVKDLTNRLVDRATAYGMEVSVEKSKIMSSSLNSISAGISMNGQKLEEVTSFKYLGAVLCKDGTCSAEGWIRISSAMARLNRIWQCNTRNILSKFKLYKSPVTSIFLCGCGTRTMLADTEKKRIQAFETKCMRKLLRISNLGHKTNV